ncbi:MAG: EutN/CcmL family microcompartment protein [Desulfobacteraceae bacterium]|nr:EutN/CcmL family microcompartment protein [Desulfobacteraceae bacterium]
MIICKVLGSVWATRKDDALSGVKLMIVRRLEVCNNTETESFVAADFVGAGIGDRVLVATGSSARNACGQADAPIDATIVGIIDELETGMGD